MTHNNKMKGLDIPAQKITRKDAMEVLGAFCTLLTLCPAMVVSVQHISSIL